MYCVKCGKQIAADSIFCRHCGQMLNDNSSNPEVKQDAEAESIKKGKNKAKNNHKNRFAESWKKKSKLFKLSLMFSVFSIAQLVITIFLLVELHGIHEIMDDNEQQISCIKSNVIRMNNDVIRMTNHVSSIESIVRSIESDVSDINSRQQYGYSSYW